MTAKVADCARRAASGDSGTRERCETPLDRSVTSGPGTTSESGTADRANDGTSARRSATLARSATGRQPGTGPGRFTEGAHDIRAEVALASFLKDDELTTWLRRAYKLDG